MSVTDEIKTRLDIVNYIQQFVPLKKAGRNYKACCPFHSEKTPSFVVNPEMQSWRCFGSCAEGGDIFSFAQKYHGWGFREALEELGRQAGVELREQTAEQQQRAERLDTLRGMTQAAADFYHEALAHNDAVMDYVIDGRGFSEQTLIDYQIGYAPDGWQTTLDHLSQLGYSEDDLIEVGLARRSEQGRAYDYFRHRLVIPIRDERGRVIGFGARVLSDEDNPKYLNSPQTPLFDKSRTLFGLDRAARAIRDSETAVIVEGYMDAIQAHQAGYLNVVAQMGTALTEQQLQLLANKGVARIVLALDADEAGLNATERSKEAILNIFRLKQGFTTNRKTSVDKFAGSLSIELRILQVPDAKDPDDLIRESPERWELLVNQSPLAEDFFIHQAVRDLPADASIEYRERVGRELLPLLLATEPSVKSAKGIENIQKMALQLRIPETYINGWAVEMLAIERARPPRRTIDTPPDAPPPDYEVLEGMQPLTDDEGQPVGAMPRPRPREAQRWEVDCLSGLLIQPDLLYQINRKLRELAGEDDALLLGPLEEFGPADFSQGEQRALMQVFLESLDQDEYAPLDYMLRRVDDVLRQILEEEILVDDLERLRPQLRHGLSVDLGVVLRRAETIDRGQQLLHNALRLRRQRIEREREDLYFTLIDEDSTQQMDLHRRIQLSIAAKARIDTELARQVTDKV